MDYIFERLLTILRFVLFLAGLVLVILGQRNIGYTGLLVMLGGLALMLLLLYDYNRRNR